MAQVESTITYTEPHPGFRSFRLAHGKGQATCDVCLSGATVVSWKVAGSEMLFVSPNNNWTAGRAIRGGIPVVFPQFGPGKLPQHGFARNKIWQHGETTINKATGDVITTFTLTDDEETYAAWPFHFELQMTVALKATSLSQKLTIINKDDKEFEFTTLLHTYFSVPHIEKVKVHGLQGLTYLDKPTGGSEIEDSDEAISFRGEVDRVYIGGGARQVIIKDGGNADLIVKSSGFKDYVVWNPSNEKAKAMADLGEENYPHFVCVEAGSVAQPVKLAAGQTWEGSQGFSIRLHA